MENKLKKIRKNQKLLDTLSNEQLEKLSEYYDKVMEKNDEIIRSKKLQIAKLKKVG